MRLARRTSILRIRQNPTTAFEQTHCIVLIRKEELFSCVACIVLWKSHEWRRIAIEERKANMGFMAKILLVGILLSFSGAVSGCVIASDEGEINATSDALVPVGDCQEEPCTPSTCGDGICASVEVGRCIADCGPPPAPYIQWSPWLNRDNPGGTGDWEMLADFTTSQVGCSLPAFIEAQTTTGVSWQNAGENLTVSPDVGLVCRNADQSDGACRDYRVRFGCATLDWTALPRSWHEDTARMTGSIEAFVPTTVSVPVGRFVEEMTFGSNGSFSILRLAPNDAHYNAYGTWTRNGNVISVSYYDTRINVSIQESYRVAELTSSMFRFRRM